jgi:glycosyltransferase involved in cell wall biosynthesis
MSRPLKIAVNARFLLAGQLEGIGYFTHETLRRITAAHPEITFYFLFDRPSDPSFIYGPNVQAVVLNPPARHPLLWYIWFQWAVKRHLAQHDYDLFLSPDGYTVLGSKTPSVTVIHDLAFLHFPQHVGALVRLYYRFFVPRFARQSSRIATVSLASKNDLVAQYGISPEKIDLVFSAAKELFHPVTTAEKNDIRNKWTDGKPYVVYVGSIHPRKNVERLLLAFELFRQKSGIDAKLLIAGRKAWQYEAVERVYKQMTYNQDILFTGRLCEEELNAVIASSCGLFFVSLFEGFGVPVLEGMRCGVPVVTANVSSMPEVAGSAAILVNPLDTEEIANAMQRLFTDKACMEEMVTRGYEQAKVYSWDNTAARLWDCCQKVLAG